MTIPKFDQLTGSETLPQLIEMVAKLQKQVQWLMDGKISSNNVREIGGYNVNDTDLKSVDGDVGLSSANDVADPVRLWAGGVDKNSAPWRVSKSGKMVATGALIQSQSGYPKVVLDPSGQLFGAYKDASNYVEMNANYAGSPVINVVEGGSVRGQISSLSNKMRISGTGDMDVNASGDVVVTPGLSNFLRVSTFAKIFGTSEGKNLLAALGEKVNTTTAFSSYAVNMSFDPATRNLKLFAGNGATLATVNIP